MKVPFFAVAMSMAFVASGCSQSSESALPYQTAARATARDVVNSSGYRTLYSFSSIGTGSAAVGFAPVAGLIDVNGDLYGTTSESYDPVYPASGYDGGAVFSLTPAGIEHVAYAFDGPRTPGDEPMGALLEVDGTLYGTNASGSGISGIYSGAVFKLGLNGGSAELVHAFAGGTDGANPAAGLNDLRGVLYGVTSNGGAYGKGTVFSITTSGKERVLYSFGKTNSDGRYPSASLIAVNGKLYGSTQSGGTSNDGTVFSVTPSGTERLLYSFRNGADGSRPVASVVKMGNALYGTTENGGAYGEGTVFSLTLTGQEKVLHSFGGTDIDGRAPLAALIVVGNTLYGTTSLGGTYLHDINGGGAVFSISATGTEKVLHSFGNGKDGIMPMAPLVAVSGTLYGTTKDGGSKDCGTVFALKL
jgi:uncharacterized repeat protein (TIGR03803 family)